MKKNELMNGDIVVTREGYLAVVILNGIDDYILYQTIGSDPLDMYNDDLTYDEEEDYPEGDIMEVYRGATFYEVDDQGEIPVWFREIGWVRPTEEERKAMQEQKEQERQKMLEEMRSREEKTCEEKAGVNSKIAEKKRCIDIITYSFYCGRIATSIRPERVDQYIRGNLDFDDPVDDGIDRTVIHIPGTDGVVFIYNKYQQEKALTYVKECREEHRYVTKPWAEIPEMGLQIYSQVIACRMNQDGELESLQAEDYKVCMKYFAEW